METMIPQYETMTFNDVFQSEEQFINDIGSYKGQLIDQEHMEFTYLLLSARYGNSPIANRSVNQFKLKCWAVIFQYGPSWVKKLQIQEQLRSLNVDELREGSKATFNQAMNPEVAPGTGTDEELPYVNAQNVNKYRKGKVEAYAALAEVLRNDVTEEYISRFKPLFKNFVMPEQPLLFVEEGEEDGN